jgi:hypothetical protein
MPCTDARLGTPNSITPLYTDVISRAAEISRVACVEFCTRACTPNGIPMHSASIRRVLYCRLQYAEACSCCHLKLLLLPTCLLNQLPTRSIKAEILLATTRLFNTAIRTPKVFQNHPQGPLKLPDVRHTCRFGHLPGAVNLRHPFSDWVGQADCFYGFLATHRIGR